MVFLEASRLRSARLSVKAANVTFGEDEFAWLDVKKDRAELRPGRIVHRMAEILIEIESAKEDQLGIEKFLNGKYIKVGTNRVGFTYKGEWQWTK